jgi:nucleoside-triphosphatase THEP1
MITNLWTEKYRPTTLNGYVFADENQKNTIKKWIADKDIPHVLLTGGPGVGKTTLAKILTTELEVDPFDVLFINASRENSVDDMRDKITNFVALTPWGKQRILILDECLDENTLVTVFKEGKEQKIAIKDLNEEQDLVKSFNIERNRFEWTTFKLLNKGYQETVEIEFENGEIIICTPDHKWFVEDKEGNVIVVKTIELEKYNHILTP